MVIALSPSTNRHTSLRPWNNYLPSFSRYLSFQFTPSLPPVKLKVYKWDRNDKCSDAEKILKTHVQRTWRYFLMAEWENKTKYLQHEFQRVTFEMIVPTKNPIDKRSETFIIYISVHPPLKDLKWDTLPGGFYGKIYTTYLSFVALQPTVKTLELYNYSRSCL